MRDELLSILEKNSRIDFKELAVLLGVTEEQVLHEITKLEKENIIAKVEMNNKNYINKDEGISNKKQNDDIYKACKYSGKMFNEIDDEIIENMDIEGCNKNK